MESTRGQLLIAGPTLADPNFFRTVVLIIEHSADGALGLVLNRRSETAVGDVASELDPLVETEDALWVGGPVAPSALIVLAEFEHIADAALIAFEDIG
ncbi:MAG: YqgE/AlgH family protein, partial [Actinomycetota bacterium]|nr:YqgE/AlgH family protein [Actinomycetota bacterium]